MATRFVLMRVGPRDGRQDRLNVEAKPMKRPNDEAAVSKLVLQRWVVLHPGLAANNLAVLLDVLSAGFSTVQGRAGLTQHLTAASVL
jgi:hypothetical protein